MNKTLRSLFAFGALAVLAAILIATFGQTRKAPADQEEEEQKGQAARKPSWASVQKGQTILTLDPQTQSRAGITVGQLQPVSTREHLAAPASVLSVQDLVAQRSASVAARTRLEKAEANVEVSGKEYERLTRLYQDNQNASAKSLQSAEGAFRSDQAEAEAARQEVALQAAAIRQGWGSVISQWVVDGSPALQQVLDQHELLVRVTLPLGYTPAAPPSASLQIPGGRLAEASLISPYPGVDPRVQGLSSLYKTQAHSGLAPGMNLVAHLPMGRRRQGVLVPETAVVWWQGKAWIYRQIAPNRFTRCPVPTDDPLATGYFVAGGLSPADKIVLHGADWLISEEFRYQAQPEGED